MSPTYQQFIHQGMRTKLTREDLSRDKVYLVHERLVEEVWSSDTEVKNIDFLQDGIVEGIQKPGCVGHLWGCEVGM